MKTQLQFLFSGMLVAAVAAAGPRMPASAPNATGVQAQMVITVEPGNRGGNVPENLEAGAITVVEGNSPRRVVGLERLRGPAANMQLFVLLDDSTRSSSLGIQLPELKKFVASLPATTQVAVGYMNYGAFDLLQAFTADHQQAAAALRLPAAMVGGNGSPYFALSYLARHWPSEEPAGRRVVLMFTDGVDRYYGAADYDDPYVDTAVNDALRNDLAVYAVYLRGAGFYGQRGLVRDYAQSRLSQLSSQTGGYAYFEALSDPVSIAPFLSDFTDRLDHQYRVTFNALNKRGIEPVKLRTEFPGVKIEGPSRVYVR
jgi:hypothetical protein